MPKKKSVKKKKTNKSKKKNKKTVSRTAAKTSSDAKIEKVLVENFVALQKVMTNLSGKFDNLANQISKLLDLFEISAKSLAKKDFDLGFDKSNEELNKKVDSLLDQNKTIARGLTLLHEPESSQASQVMPPRAPVQPRPPQMNQLQRRPVGMVSTTDPHPAIGVPQNNPEQPPSREEQPKDPRQSIGDMSGYEKSLPVGDESGSVIGENQKKGLGG